MFKRPSYKEAEHLAWKIISDPAVAEEKWLAACTVVDGAVAPVPNQSKLPTYLRLPATMLASLVAAITGLVTAVGMVTMLIVGIDGSSTSNTGDFGGISVLWSFFAFFCAAFCYLRARWDRDHKWRWAERFLLYWPAATTTAFLTLLTVIGIIAFQQPNHDLQYSAADLLSWVGRGVLGIGFLFAVPFFFSRFYNVLCRHLHSRARLGALLLPGLIIPAVLGLGFIPIVAITGLVVGFSGDSMISFLISSIVIVFMAVFCAGFISSRRALRGKSYVSGAVAGLITNLPLELTGSLMVLFGLIFDRHIDLPFLVFTVLMFAGSMAGGAAGRLRAPDCDSGELIETA